MTLFRLDPDPGNALLQIQWCYRSGPTAPIPESRSIRQNAVRIGNPMFHIPIRIKLAGVFYTPTGTLVYHISM
jgi:hypothetical protein